MRHTAHPGSLLFREPRRVIGVLRLLFFLGLAAMGLHKPPDHHFLYWFLTLVYGLTSLGYLAARDREYRQRRVLGLVFLFDVALVSGAIVLRGESVPEFLAGYYSLVLMASILEGLGRPVVNAVLLSVLYAAVTRWGSGAAAMLELGTVSQFLFFVIVATFMAHMAHEAHTEASGKEVVQAALRQTSSELQQSTEELKAARDVLRANDRLSTLGMLSAGITHEMKNPLAAIANSLEPAHDILEELLAAVRAGGDGSGEARELLEILDDCGLACRQLLRVARDLTSIARGGTPVPVPVDPGEVIDGALRMLKTRVKPPVRIHGEARTHRTILADPGRVLQVLLNLAGNALDALDGRGGGEVSVLAEDAGPHTIAFVVQDTGPGVPPEIQARIFEPFFTTKGPGRGTGLGLHLVSEITKSLRGSVRYEDAAGGGARFCVELPVHAGRNRPETSDERGPEDHPDRRRRGHDPQGAGAHVPAGAL